MKRFVKTQLEQRAPALLNGIQAIRNRRYFRRTFSGLHAEFREMLFSSGVPIAVRTGPFQGMRYFDETVWGSITPKWLGSYEAELHSIINAIVERSYETVINVGCAEGYYVVGLATILPAAKIFAFDTDFISRAQVRRLAKLNGVADRVEIRALCGHSDLDTLSAGNTVIVCDIEGFEAQLLDPGNSVSLLRSDILVEIHESSNSSVTVERLLQSRFTASHSIQRITAATRDAWINQNRQHLPANISGDKLHRATEENRATGRVWLWMQAKRA